jgi:hypothetical protein
MIDITVTRHAVDGFTLSTMDKGYLVSKRYIGYTYAEATRLFKQYLKEAK